MHCKVRDVGKVAETRHTATESASIADSDVLHMVPRPPTMDSVCPIRYIYNDMQKGGLVVCFVNKLK